MHTQRVTSFLRGEAYGFANAVFKSVVFQLAGSGWRYCNHKLSYLRARAACAYFLDFTGVLPTVPQVRCRLEAIAA